MKKGQIYMYILVFITILLAFLIFKWSDYLIKNDFIRECFDPSIQNIQDRGTPYTNHNVDLPLNTIYSCSNICGPNSRCYKTGQQCLSDIDCPGCQPYSPPLPKSNTFVPGENDAGKLTTEQYPTYSSLTTDIGTQSKIYSNNKFQAAPQANFGENIWRGKYSIGENLFDERYKPKNLQFMPNYPSKYTLSGEFMTDGPLASNAYIS
jgi:hypothetical protein